MQSSIGGDGYQCPANESCPLYGDTVNAIALDRYGEVFVTGATTSVNFPLVNPIQSTLQGGTSAFVTRIDAADCTILFSTYLGGSEPASMLLDYPVSVGTGIALDPTYDIYVAGYTASTSFPVKNAFQGSYAGPVSGPLGDCCDGFVTKVSPK
jgi:hypothetical protein